MMGTLEQLDLTHLSERLDNLAGGASPQLLTGSYSAPVQGSNAISEIDNGS